MKPYEERGCSPRGADMGRHSSLPHHLGEALYLDRVPMNSGGCYDPGGAYWGAGTTLWCVYNSDGRARYLRAETAKEVRAQFPRARWEKDGNLDEFVGAMIGEALDDFNSAEEHQDHVKEHGAAEEDDLAESTRQELTALALLFFAKRYGSTTHTVEATLKGGLAEESGMTFARAGHYFWHSQGGSSVGLFDFPPLGKELHRLAQACCRDKSLYLGDDGKVYL